MKKSILILTALTTLFLGACKKDKDNNPGGGSGTYQPFTKNSVWKYRETVKIGAIVSVDTATHTMADSTKTIGTKKYHIAVSVTGDDTSSVYIGQNNDVYSTFYDAGEGNTLELGYLNDKKAVGESWETTGVIEDEGEEIEAKIKTTIVAKGINYTVLGKAFSNVIHTKAEIQAKIGANFQTIATIEYYVAKNIGIIATSTKVNGVEVGKSELFNYTIK